MFKVCFYVPTTHVEKVKSAMFNAGAGKIGNYSCCAWQVLGEGQFMPLEGNNAFIGSTNQLETIAEYKVEMICALESLHAVIAAMKASHPYEQPAYFVFRAEEY